MNFGFDDEHTTGTFDMLVKGGRIIYDDNYRTVRYACSDFLASLQCTLFIKTLTSANHIATVVRVSDSPRPVDQTSSAQ